MEVRVTLEHLRAGEKPLAMFLHDALRSIDEQYFESIVASFARNSRDQGMSSNDHRDRMLDERGRRKTSLVQFDITFLLGLCEWLTTRTTILPEFASRLHLHADVYHKFVALRKYRNSLVHGATASADLATTIGALGKILDVFRNELLTCCHSQPEIFGEDTTRQVQSYVDSIVKLLVDAQDSLKASQPIILEESDVEEVEDVDAQFVDDAPVGSSAVVPKRQSSLASESVIPNRRPVVIGLIGLVLCLIVVATALYNRQSVSTTPIEPKPTRAAILIVNEPFPTSALELFRREISGILLSTQEYWLVTVIRYGMPDTAIVTQLNPQVIDQRLLDVLRTAPALPKVTDITDMFQRLKNVLSDTSVVRLRPRAYAFGSYPNPTDDLYAELNRRGKKNTKILYIHGLKEAFATMNQSELRLFCFDSPRYVDSALTKTIMPDSTGFKLILTEL